MNDITPVDTSSKAIALLDDRFSKSDLQAWHGEVNTDRKAVLRSALFVFVMIFVVGGIAADQVPLGGSVSVQGRVVAEFGNRQVQHLEGGILKQVLVREGDKVVKGQPLAFLEETQYFGRLLENRLQKALLRIQLARSRANAKEQSDVTFPGDIHTDVRDDARVKEAIASQRDQFYADKQVRLADIKNFDAQASGQRNQIRSLTAQKQSVNESLALSVIEAKVLQELYDDGKKTSRDRLFAAKRRLADDKARLAGLDTELATRQENLLTLETQKEQARYSFISESNASVIQLQSLLNRTEGQLSGLEDVINRLVIRSPVNGTVFKVPNYTLGAVFQRGEGLFEIFPDEDALMIEGFLDVKHAEAVEIGQDVDVVFPSNRSRSVDAYEAKLIYISPDSAVSEQRPEGGYIVRVKLENPDDAEDLYPGNIAQIYIKTRPKTFLQILASPLKRFGLNVFNE